jgi:hypothetical protein
VGPVDLAPPQANDLASYDVVGSCAAGGIVMDAGARTATATWGTSRTLNFATPAGTQIVKLALSRDSYAQATGSGGRWAIVATLGDGAALGGPFGPDQCRPGFGFPNPCGTGAAGYGENAISRYDLATS